MSAIRDRVRSLGDWFDNINLRGVQTAPDQFLGDYPSVKRRRVAHAIPEDLRGRSVRDVGGNAGFYAIEMKRRGAARVPGVDSDERYLARARFAAEVAEVDVEFRRCRCTSAAGARSPPRPDPQRSAAAVRWMRELGVTYVRTGMSWADSLRPNAQAWFDRQMRALDPFHVTLTFCFTPEAEGIRPHHTSPPRDVTRFADFCADQIRRYG